MAEQSVSKSVQGDPPLPKGDQNCNPAGIGVAALLWEDLNTYNMDLFDEGFLAVAIHRFGNWRMGFRRKIVRAPLTLVYLILHRCCQWMCGIDLPYTMRLGRRVRIWSGGGLIFVARSIGDDVQIRHRTTVGVRRTGANAGIPVIGDRVNIGCGACILGSVCVGHDSVIGANAVVLCDVPAGATAVGVPARIIPAVVPNGEEQMGTVHVGVVNG